MGSTKHRDMKDCERWIEKRRPGFLHSGWRQPGERVSCGACGRVFEHVCDEAEGCSWRYVRRAPATTQMRTI